MQQKGFLAYVSLSWTLRGPYQDGPASGEDRSHICRRRILGYFGLDPPKRGSGLVGNKLISVQGVLGQIARGEMVNLESIS